MILGLRTVIYPAPDLEAGRAWYAKVIGQEPYFDQPFYVGFSVGGFELGLIPDGAPGTVGSQAYWGVADIEAEVKRIAHLGGVIHDPIKDVGEGIKVATLRDPFGNLFGLIENPHFDAKNVR